MTVPDELRALYPDLTDEKLFEAKENLDRYLLLAWEIMEEAGLVDGHDDHP